MVGSGAHEVAAVALGGSLGALARYGVAALVARWWQRPFPLATLVINVAGCLLLGWFLGRNGVREGPGRLFFATGFCGAFTTFSTFAHETRALASGGLSTAALGNVVLSLALGYVAVIAGARLGGG